MNEPDNHAAVVDRFGDTWVRVDETPGAYGTWWPCTDGHYWDDYGKGSVGTARTWDEVEEYGPLTLAGPDRAAAALDRVRRA